MKVGWLGGGGGRGSAGQLPHLTISTTHSEPSHRVSCVLACVGGNAWWRWWLQQQAPLGLNMPYHLIRLMLLIMGKPPSFPL